MTHRKLVSSLAAFASLCAIGLVHDRGIAPRPSDSPPALRRSDAVVEAKIARERAESGGGDRAEHPDGYTRFRSMIRTHSEGTTVAQLLMDAKRHVERMDPVPGLGGDRDAGLWAWDWLGPGNVGGRVRAILLHPTDANTMWIGSAGGGIWKTTSGGSSWYPLQDFLPSLAITSLAMDPNDPDVIYAGTGEGFGNIDALPGAGIFKSIDGGNNWSHFPELLDPDAYYVNDVAHHPTQSGTLIAAAAPEGITGVVWRTLNGGDDWSVVLTTPRRALDVKYDPDDPGVVIVGTSNGAWRSEVSGNPGTWTEISVGGNQLPDIPGRCEFAFHEGSDVVYASCNVPRGEDQPRGELWRSLDNGATWDLRNDTTFFLGGQGWYDNVVWVEPEYSTSVIVGGINLYKSIDGGATLEVMSNWSVYHLNGQSAHADQHAIVPHIDYGMGDNLTIFFGNDGGVQMTTLGFLTQPTTGWTNLANNLGITQFYHADCTPDGEIILGGAQDNDDLRFRRVDGAQDWYQAETGDGTFCAINPADPDTMHACYPWLKMQRSTNGGRDYFNMISGLGDAGDPDRALFISPFALDKTRPSHLVAGGRSLWLSENHGGSWSETLEPLPGSPLCSAIEISPTAGSEVIWAGYTNGKIWVTEDGMENWYEWEGFGGPLPDEFVTDIEISPHDPDVVLVSFSGYAADRIWLSTDDGQTWTALNGTGNNTLPPVHVSCVSFHPINPDWIYAGTDIGLFASEDMGQNWNVTSRYGTNEGPVFTEIADLVWHSYSTLVAVTHGRGMYECMPLPVVWVDLDYVGEEDGTIAHPWNTFAEAENAIGNGATMILRGGDYQEGARVVRKRIELKGSEGAVILR